MQKSDFAAFALGRRVSQKSAGAMLAALLCAGGAQAAEWGTRAPLPEPNSEMAVAELDGRIYVIGGYPSTRIAVRTVQVYDSKTDRWRLTTPVPAPINHAVAAVVRGKIYLIGGQSNAGGRRERSRYVDTVYEFDPATEIWRTRKPMPTKRSGGAAAVVDGKIYVAGGRPPRGHDFAVYDPANDRWITLPDLPTQRNHLAAASIGGKVYVVGGRFGGGFRSKPTAALEVFDPRTKSWTAKRPMPAPRGGINGIAVLGCLHTFGGEHPEAGPNGVFSQHEVYNPKSDSWHKMPPIPIPVHGVTGAAFLDGWIHLPGGGTRMGGSSGGTHHQVVRPAMKCG